MNKISVFYICVLALVITAGLSACGGKAPPEPEMPESGVYSEPYFEIIESAERKESSREPEAEESSGITEALPNAEIPAKRDSFPLPEESSVPPVPAPGADASKAELLPGVAIEATMDEAKIERELLRLINAERTAVGAEALGEEENMRFAARIRAAETIESFSHTRPDGSTYNTAFDEAGFSYAGKWHGENLASLRFTNGMLDEKGAAQEMFAGLKNSPGHYSNMINNNFLQAGVGVSLRCEDGIVNIASVQLFSSL